MNNYYQKLVYISIKTSYKYDNILDFEELDPTGSLLFYNRFNDPEKNLEQIYFEKASNLPEYSILTCISIGYFVDGELRIKSLTGEEDEIIKSFTIIMNNFSKSNNSNILCGFDLKNFELPYLNKKIISKGYKIPIILRTYKMKPWEMNIEDIGEIWKFNAFYKAASIAEIAYYLEIDKHKVNILMKSMKDDVKNYHNLKIEEIVYTNELKLEVLTDISNKLFKSIRK